MKLVTGVDISTLAVRRSGIFEEQKSSKRTAAAAPKIAAFLLSMLIVDIVNEQRSEAVSECRVHLHQLAARLRLHFPRRCGDWAITGLCGTAAQLPKKKFSPRQLQDPTYRTTSFFFNNAPPARMGKIKKKGVSGQAKNFITRTQAVRKLQIT